MGTKAVRDYWNRQWSAIDPHVEPLEINPDERGRWVVSVHQVVRDLQGRLLLDKIVLHAYQFSGFLISRMDIE